MKLNIFFTHAKHIVIVKYTSPEKVLLILELFITPRYYTDDSKRENLEFHTASSV
jgi:hypothetical protein